MNDVVEALSSSAGKEVSITEAMVADARSKGVSYVCAHCELFWEGILKKLDRCMAMSQKKPCGSVFVGMTFPEYKGPLSRDTLPNFCFVCGVEATDGVQVDGKSEMLGVCEDHLKWVEQAKAMREKKAVDSAFAPPKEG
jgi:hypothetical protein